MTRIEKYRDLRNAIDEENQQIRQDLNSENLLSKIKALCIAHKECKGKRVCKGNN